MAIVRIQDSCGNWVIINTVVGVTAEDLGLGNVQSDLTYLTNRKAKKSSDPVDERGNRLGNIVLSDNFNINSNNGEITLHAVPANTLTGVIAAANLPSYVDDVIEGYYLNGQFYSDSGHAHVITPESGKIYLDITNPNKPKSYRWSGTVYVEISGGTDLEPATASRLGGVKVGANLTVQADGTLSADAQPVPHADGTNWGTTNPSVTASTENMNEVYIDTATGKLYTQGYTNANNTYY